MQRFVILAVVVVGLSCGSIINKQDEPMTAADSIEFLCNNITDDEVGLPQALGRCYNRYFVCSEADGKRVWETFSCDDCMKFDEDLGECRPQSQIEKCQIDADGYDILNIDDVLLACDRIQFDEPIFAPNPKKSCSNVYMQCAINTMGVEDDFRYDVIAGGILFCDNASMAFDNSTQSCKERELVEACLNVRAPRNASLPENGTASNATTDDEWRSAENSTDGVEASTNATDVVMANSTVLNNETSAAPLDNSTVADNSTEIAVNETAPVQDLSVRRKRLAENATAENSTMSENNVTAENMTISDNLTISENSTVIAENSPMSENATVDDAQSLVNSTSNETLAVRRKRQTESISNATVDSDSSSVDNATAASATSTVGPLNVTQAVRRKRQAANVTAEPDMNVENTTAVSETVSTTEQSVENVTAANETVSTSEQSVENVTAAVNETISATEQSTTVASEDDSGLNVTAASRARRHARAADDAIFDDDYDMSTKLPLKGETDSTELPTDP